MKYIIMCGGTYPKFSTPRQLIEIKGEPIVARTIRLLRENGVEDIAISSNNRVFEQFGVPVLRHVNTYVGIEYDKCLGSWYECFHLVDEPVCYIFGDVVFSPKAIKTIVEYQTDDIMFFASAPPFAPEYPKEYVEPFAFKVQNVEHFKHALNNVRYYDKQGLFARQPIAWEVWQVINGASLDYRAVDYSTFVHINDYTCDIDFPEEVKLFEGVIDG